MKRKRFLTLKRKTFGRHNPFVLVRLLKIVKKPLIYEIMQANIIFSVKELRGI